MAKKGNSTLKNNGYEAALKYPLFDSIFNRRSRRFGLGMELADSSLEFKSSAPPIPLDEVEDGRANLPDKMPGLFDFNQWNTNKPGATTFIPVTDVTEEYLNLLHLYCSSSYAFQIIDDLTGKPAGIDHWIKQGRIKENVKLSLFDLEVRILTGLNVEQAFICQNMSLALQALGLAGWTFSGFIPRFAMGAAPQLFKGLGFRFIQPKKGSIDPAQTVPVGRDGVFQGYCPPYYKAMNEALEHFLEH